MVRFGWSLANAGDVDGDGLDDLAIGVGYVAAVEDGGAPPIAHVYSLRGCDP